MKSSGKPFSRRPLRWISAYCAALCAILLLLFPVGALETLRDEYTAIPVFASSDAGGEQATATKNLGTLLVNENKTISLNDDFLSDTDDGAMTIHSVTPINRPSEKFLECAIARVLPQWESRPVARVSFSGDAILISGNRMGESRIEIIAQDNAGAAHNYTGIVTVRDVWLIIRICALCALIPAVVIGVFFLIFKARLLRKRDSLLVKVKLNQEIIPRKVLVRGSEFRLCDLLDTLVKNLQRGQIYNPEQTDKLRDAVNACRDDLLSDDYLIRSMPMRDGRIRKRAYYYGSDNSPLGGTIYSDERNGTGMEIIVEVDTDKEARK